MHNRIYRSLESFQKMKIHDTIWDCFEECTGLWRFILAVLLLALASSAKGADNSTLFASEQGAILKPVTRDGLVFWGGMACGAELVPPTPFVRSQPVGGGPIRTIFSRPTCDNNALAGGTTLAIDDTFVYWANVQNQIVRQSRIAAETDLPTVIATSQTTPVGAVEVAVDALNLYWLEVNAAQTAGRLVCQPKAGGNPIVWTIPNAKGLSHLMVDSSGAVYYFSFGAITRLTRNGNQFTAATLGALGLVETYTLDQFNLYWVEQQTQTSNLLIKISALNNLAQVDTMYTIPGLNTPRGDEMAADGSFLYWNQSHPGFSSEIIRLPLVTGTGPVTMTSYGPNFVGGPFGLISAVDYIFWVVGVEIRRLPVSSPGLDLTAQDQMPEVVQVIQGPSNDVPLVENKDTFVRVYGRIDPNSTNATSMILSPSATLTGTRAGQTLPGSPLTPLVDTMFVGTAPLDRRTGDGSVVFELPSSWTTGTITLQTNLNPAHVLTEGNYDNNKSSSTVTFQTVPTHCIQIVPVSTTSGVFTAPSPTLTSLVNRAITVYPLTNFSLGFIGGPPLLRPNIPFGITGSGPYTLNSDFEMGYLLWNMWWAYVFDTGFACEGGGTTVAGPVPSATRTGMSSPGVMFFLTRTIGDPANAPLDGIDGLAHELGHELNRSHVACPTSGPGAPASPGFYPYPTCQLDFDTPSAHVGFDSISHTLLPPGTTADMMSYFPGELWISDYNYRANMNQLRGDGGLVPLIAKRQIASGGPVTNTQPLTQIGGMLGSQPFVGFAFPIDAPEQEAVEARINAATQLSGDYELRAYGKDGQIIFKEPLRIVPVETEGGEPIALFFQTVRGTPERYEVVANDGTVVAKRTAGPHAPKLTVKKPKQGEAYTDSMKVEWEASDADGDHLLFALRYSADAGHSWRMLGGFTSENSLLLDLGTLPGGSSVLIEVMASDGVHVTTATAGPLQVASHAPHAIITDTTGREVTEAAPLGLRQSQQTTLIGEAYDVEDGMLKGQALKWNLGGPFAISSSGNKFEVASLTPGNYQVEFSATDSEGKTGTAKGAIAVAPKRIPRGSSTPKLDGRCSDLEYGRDNDPITVRFNGGTSAILRAILVGKSLYACLSGIPLGDHTDLAGLRFSPQKAMKRLEPADWTFALSPEGKLAIARPDQSGHWKEESSAQNAVGAASQSDLSWSAEFRIDADVLGTEPLIRMQLFQDRSGKEVAWPKGSRDEEASSWGLIATGKIEQTIAFSMIPNHELDETGFVLQASASSGLGVSYTAAGTCGVVSNRVSFTQVGACSVTAAQPGDDNYLPALPVTRSFVICKNRGGNEKHDGCCLRVDEGEAGAEK